MRQINRFAIFVLLIITSTGCNNIFTKELTADLSISNMDFKEINNYVSLDLPNGVYQPDNPNFDINDPETWTGNMAQYVKHYYLYSVSCKVQNYGNGTAYDTEIDFHYTYYNGKEEFETVYIGEVNPNKSTIPSVTHVCVNKQLKSCNSEVFWYDY